MSGFCNNQDSGVGQQKKVNQTSAPLTSFKLPQLRGIICDLGDMHFWFDKKFIWTNSKKKFSFCKEKISNKKINWNEN